MTSPTESQLRWFAAVWFPATAAMLGWIAYPYSRAAALAIGFSGALLTITSLAVPRLRRPLWNLTSALTYPLGWVLSRTVLTLTYFLIVTPLAGLLRLTGHDPLSLRPTPSATTYWHRRPAQRPLRDYLQQF
ncbi:MAG: SxtJ family membrane protein [Pirellulaceae bacterium]